MKNVGIVFLLLFIGYGIYYYTQHRQSPRTGRDDGTFCTEDALLCPDGSYVSREGEDCSFTACATKESFFEGTLIQKEGSFVLLLPAPESARPLTTYEMPLQVNVSNALGQLVGKRVSVQGEFQIGNVFVVDQIESAVKDPAIGEVGIGQTLLINGLSVTLIEVVQDNRCPTDVACIEGGAITARVTLDSGNKKETRNMASDEVPLSFDGYALSIEGVYPLRVSSVEPEKGAYVVTFRVVKQ